MPPRAVADRSRHRAGAVRADRQIAGGVERHDRAAARADLGHVDERQLDRIAAALHELARQIDAGADLVFGGARRLAVLDHGGLGRRAAHVERDRIGKPERARHAGAGDHAGRRTGFDRVGRLLARAVERHDAAVRLHDLQRRADADGADVALERVEIVAHDRPDIGAHHRRAGALVLADLRQDIGRAGHVDAVGNMLAHDLGDAPLVRRIGIGMQQRDRDGLRRLLPSAPSRPR